jgi:CheY-like chemotaxis protein
VAILDIRMPGGGLHVLEAVKGGESPPVVIMLTAFPYPQYRKRCLEAGAEHFLDKATEFDQIAVLLGRLVGNVLGERQGLAGPSSPPRRLGAATQKGGATIRKET